MTTGLPLDQLPLRNAGDGFNLLQGVRVIDVTTSIAGPYATMLLSDFGAEVIKVERAEGDDARSWGPPFLDEEALWFLSVNRNKKSVVLNVHDAQNRKQLERLINSADVYVTNQLPRVQKKLHLAYEDVKNIREDIVFASITGFGLAGERSDLTCYDLIAEGYSGIMDVTGEASGPPQKIGAPAADMLAGQDAAMAILAALFERAKSRKGHLIDISLVESMTRFLAPRLSSYLGSGEVPKRSGGTDSVIAIYQAFDTLDKQITLGLGSDGIWRRFCEAVGLDKFIDIAGYSTNSERRSRRGEIVSAIQQKLLTKTREEWLTIFRAARVPAGPINQLDEVSMDQFLQKRGMFYTLSAEGRKIPQVGLGIHIDGKEAVAKSAPPSLGQHTLEIMDEGINDERALKSGKG